MAKKRTNKNDLNEEQERFASMSRDERAEVIRPLMAAGATYSRIAMRFGVKRGMIAGICRNYKIPSTHPPGYSHVQKSESGVPLKLAPPGPTQCEAMIDRHQCGFLKEPGSRYCALPQHQALAKRKD